MIIAATGHRPPRLGLGYDAQSNRALREFAQSHLPLLSPSRIISGGAQGWDQAVAEAALDLGIAVTVAVPFEGQEAKWPGDARERYEAILRRSEVVIVCPGGYANWKFVRRDEWMVDQAELVLALWDGGENGGTWLTVRYADEKDVEVENLWDKWVSPV